MDMKRGKREEDGGEAYLMKRSTGSTAVTAARCSPDPAPARPLKAARTGSRSSLAVGTGSRGLPARGPWSLPRLTADSQATRASHREREREARVKRVREAGVERERERRSGEGGAAVSERESEVATRESGVARSAGLRGGFQWGRKALSPCIYTKTAIGPHLGWLGLGLF
jgi:hypothetical protein